MSDDDISTDFGVQDDGTFRRKHVDRIREDAIRRVKDTAGENIEFRPGSPQQAIIDMHAQEAAIHWQALEEVYYAGFYPDAKGEALGKQLALAGFQRQSARSATGEVVFSRDDPAPDDIEIDEGTVVTTSRTETRPPIPFEVTEGVVLPEGETEVTASIEALKPWQTDLDEEWLGEETNVSAGSITRIQDPIAGVNEVTNPVATGDEDEGFTAGRDRETDAEFKLRYENSLAEGGAATRRAIEAAVFNAHEDIHSVDVDEVRDETDGYGVKVTVVAPGVDDQEIAKALAGSRAWGLKSFGDEEATIEVNGKQKTERFDRADELTVYVEGDLTTSDTFPDDGTEEIIDRVIRYIGGEASDGISYPGLGIGEEVVYDQVFRRIMETRGVVMADLEIGTDPNDLGTENIGVGTDEAAMTGINEVSTDVDE